MNKQDVQVVMTDTVRNGIMVMAKRPYRHAQLINVCVLDTGMLLRNLLREKISQ